MGASWDRRVRYLHQPQSGTNVARNRGLQAARGELIALLDSDEDVDVPCSQQTGERRSADVTNLDVRKAGADSEFVFSESRASFLREGVRHHKGELGHAALVTTVVLSCRGRRRGSGRP